MELLRLPRLQLASGRGRLLAGECTQCSEFKECKQKPKSALQQHLNIETSPDQKWAKCGRSCEGSDTLSTNRRSGNIRSISGSPVCSHVHAVLVLRKTVSHCSSLVVGLVLPWLLPSTCAIVKGQQHNDG
ncbi:hypothetical protein ACLKA6_010666 [Drosophila palustris]